VTGYSGNGSIFATAALDDGGLAYGPDGILYYTRWPNNEVGEFRPGATSPSKGVGLTPLGATASVGTLQFVPPRFPGAGSLKTMAFNTGDWNNITYVPDGTGTSNLVGASRRGTLSGGPEGMAYVPLGSLQFTVASVAVCEFNTGVVSVYQVDSN